MTTRLTVLDNSKLNSSDLTVSTQPLKKDSNHGEIRFQQVLAKTEGKSPKDSTLTNLREEKRHDAKDEHDDQKPHTNAAKPINKQATNGASESNKINEERASEDFDGQNEEVINEGTQISESAIEIIPVITISTQSINTNIEENSPSSIKLEDLNIDHDSLEGLQSQKINSLSVKTPIGSEESTVDGAKLLNYSEIDVELYETILPTSELSVSDADLTSSQGIASTPINLENKNLLTPQDLLNVKTETEVLGVRENESQKATVITQGNVVNISASSGHKDDQLSNSDDIAISEAPVDEVITRAENKSPVSEFTPKTNNTAITLTREENITVSQISQSDRELSKINKEKANLPGVQNLLNQNSSEESLPIDQGNFDQSYSDSFNNNLLSNIDSFVTINDGKLSISFKEIVNLPEENIPHRADQVTMAVKSAVSKGHSEISLHMYPEDLGVVDVKIEFSEAGKVQAIKFSASNKDTLELLQRDYKALERSLSEVVKTDDASLSFNLKDGKGSESQYQPQENFSLNNFGESGERIITNNYVITTQVQEDDQVDITV